MYCIHELYSCTCTSAIYLCFSHIIQLEKYFSTSFIPTTTKPNDSKIPQSFHSKIYKRNKYTRNLSVLKSSFLGYPNPGKPLALSSCSAAPPHSLAYYDAHRVAIPRTSCAPKYYTTYIHNFTILNSRT